MAIIDITSSNPMLSWVLVKNPKTQENGPFKRVLRKGHLLGWYTKENSFRLYFKDGSESSFYKNLNNNYLNQSAYNCPFAYCSMMAEMLSAPIKSQSEHDTLVQNSITLSSVLITLPSVADFFVHFFASQVKITMTLIAKKAYKIEFSGVTSLHYLTNLAQVFCLMQSIEDKNIYIDLTPSALTKYANNLKAIEAPYFIVYLFLSRCVPDLQSFNTVKPILEQEGWSLVYGNTQRQRFEAIKRFVQGGKILHDVGCGELYYTRNLNSLYESIFCWDADSQIQERNLKFIEKKGIYNAKLMGEFTTNAVLEAGCDILITEMLEHVPKSQALEILNQIKNQPFRRLIITVPNRDFNQFYRLSHAFRHDDHLWEPTMQEISDMIKQVFTNNFKVIIKPIGDGINATHVSTLIVIDKEKI